MTCHGPNKEGDPLLCKAYRLDTGLLMGTPQKQAVNPAAGAACGTGWRAVWEDPCHVPPARGAASPRPQVASKPTPQRRTRRWGKGSRNCQRAGPGTGAGTLPRSLRPRIPPELCNFEIRGTAGVPGLPPPSETRPDRNPGSVLTYSDPEANQYRRQRRTTPLTVISSSNGSRPGAALCVRGCTNRTAARPGSLEGGVSCGVVRQGSERTPPAPAAGGCR